MTVTNLPLSSGGALQRKVSHVLFRRILFATDFSPASDRALGYAVAVARRFDSRLVVAHVIVPESALIPAESASKRVDESRMSAEKELTNLLISGRLRGVPHQVVLAEGNLWSVISSIIKEHEIDLIVIGTHGRKGVHKITLGSVAEEVFRHAGVPVMTVGPRSIAEPRGEEEVRHIACATDLGPSAKNVVNGALDLARECQAHLTIIYAMSDVSDTSARSLERLRVHFTEQLAKLVPADAGLWFDPEFQVTFGDPSSGILNLANSCRADLIVLGVRNGGNFEGHLPSGKAYRVVLQAPCPVLTVSAEKQFEVSKGF